MSLPKLETKITALGYLEGEKISPIKHEFVEGEIYAMAGGTGDHNLISGELYGLLWEHLRGSKCQPYINDIRVRVTKSVSYYPDVLVSCEENPEDPHLRNNPVLIIEVTSPSTENVDRREKLLFYQQMPTVQEYLVVDQHQMMRYIAARHTADGSPLILIKRLTLWN